MTHGGTTTSSSTTQITIQLNTDMTAAQRFPTWILLCVSSIICVLALHSRRGLLDVDDGPSEAWILSVGAISFLLSLAAIVMYLCFRTVFVSNIPEAVMVRVCVCVCVAVLEGRISPERLVFISLSLSLYTIRWMPGRIIDCVLGGRITSDYESEQSYCRRDTRRYQCR